MKLITALSTTAFVLVPAVGLAKDLSSGSGTSAKVNYTAADKSYPYPDWPAIAKTEPQKAAEQSPSNGSKGEPGLLEKAERALETITGRSTTTKEGASQEDASQLKPTAADQSARQQDMKAAGDKSYPYPDWPAIAKTEPQKGADQQKAAEQIPSNGSKGEPGLLEKAGRALETITGRSATMKEDSSQESASQMKPTAADESARQQDMKAAGNKSYPYLDWPAIAKTGPASQGSKE
jgi:hypothetical protein